LKAKDVVFKSRLDRDDIFSPDHLREITEARNKFTGKYVPTLYFARTWFLNDGGEWDSAFSFVEMLTSSLVEFFYGDSIRFGAEILGPAYDDNDEMLFPYWEGLNAFHYFRGRVETLPSIQDWEVKSELEREVRAAAALRSAGRSWFDIAINEDGKAWSEPASPAEWARRFKLSWDTLKARIDEGKIKAQKLSSKSYRIRRDHLPNNS
jgi:hypothetical protein